MAPCLNHFNMLQIISLVYMLVIVTCTGSSLSHEECSALYQFKQSIIHQDDEELCASSWFQTFHSWKPTRNASESGFDCCSWFGVECSNDHGHVIGLDLSERSLCGHINTTSTLFSLVHLQSLNLAMNHFYKSLIPSEIARLKQLRSLNLSNSGFSGQIPNEISQLIQLSSLDLSENPLKLRNPSGLKNLVQNMTRIRELHLSGVDISSFVPHLLANFTSLRSIILKNCLLQNKFPAAIFELPKLKILDVAYNTNLTGSFPQLHNSSLLEHVDLSVTGFFGIVPQSIRNLNHLKFLRLSECSFSGSIPGSISNLTQLKVLSLGNNKFIGFVPSLVSLSKLNVLELNDNNFNKGPLPNWLGMLTELTKLDANDMNLNGDIPSLLGNLTKLSCVELGSNSLIGYIPSSLFNLTQLRELDLQQNQLQGPISSSFSNFKILQFLTLSSNNFIGRVELDMFVGLNKLKSLLLGGNMISLVTTNNYTNTTLPELQILGLSTCNLTEFPAFLRFQNKMKVLVLSRNKIGGLVPVWIWNNSKETMELFGVSYNHITGFDQHPQFLKWERLEVLSIRNNPIQVKLPIPPKTTVSYLVANISMGGEIPLWLCEMKSLRHLDLSTNNMSGTLPSCLGSLSNSLVVFDIRENNFYGPMMNEFMNECLLESIDLSENQFMGRLPRSVTNCTKLEVFSLGGNSFNDVFPFWLGTLDNLQVLVLRSNKLYGPIQGSTTVFSKFPKLRIIDLSNNCFSGQVHQNYFHTWNAMKSMYVGESSVMETSFSTKSFISKTQYSMTLIHKNVKTQYKRILTIFMVIDLSCNDFEGDIPQSLQDLRGLQSLNLSNNHFTGRVWPWMGYLKNLEALDLSQNNLSGEIPQQLVQLGFLSVFNVSFNHLVGRIPQGKQFNTLDNNSYEGNPKLCGQPLSKECQGSKALALPPPSNASDSLLPSKRIDWIIVLCGVGSGLIIGAVIGNLIYERYSDRFTKRNVRWVRPLRNTRRNQGRAIASAKDKEKV